MDIYLGALTVLLATSLGAVLVLLFGCLEGKKNAAMLAFSAGAMAYSAVEMLVQAHATSSDIAVISGFGLGIIVLMIAEKILPHVHQHIRKKELEHSKKKALLIGGAIALHNIPEGFAIATAFASSIPLGWFVTTALAIQDIPEGALIAAPLVCYGMSKKRAMMFGILSGVAEAIAAIVGFLFLLSFASIVPASLAFSAGAMVYVIMVELLPDAFSNKNERLAAVAFLCGIAVAFGLASQFVV